MNVSRLQNNNSSRSSRYLSNLFCFCFWRGVTFQTKSGTRKICRPEPISSEPPTTLRPNQACTHEVQSPSQLSRPNLGGMDQIQQSCFLLPIPGLSRIGRSVTYIQEKKWFEFQRNIAETVHKKELLEKIWVQTSRVTLTFYPASVIISVQGFLVYFFGYMQTSGRGFPGFWNVF
jgi:hypothetical protein